MTGASAEPDLPEESHEVVHEILLHDLPVVPACDRVELEVEGLARGRDHRATGSLHGPGHGSPEAGNRAGPISRREKDPVRPVVETLIRKRLEEVYRLLCVVLD